MGFLNNTTITVDAILTKKGRELLAQGTEAFNITKFALSDDEIDLSMSFNISFPSNEVLKGNLPLTTKSYISDNGSLANTHYLTIPYNASNPSASKLVVNFLISPEAQLKKQDSNIWGDPNILSFKKLEKKWLKKFDELLEGPAKISQSDLQNKIAEPHPSWVLEIEKEWKKRYGSIN